MFRTDNNYNVYRTRWKQERNDTNILQRRQPQSVECFRFSGIFIRFEKKHDVKEMMDKLSDTLKVIDGSPGRAKDIFP